MVIHSHRQRRWSDHDGQGLPSAGVVLVGAVVLAEHKYETQVQLAQTPELGPFMVPIAQEAVASHQPQLLKGVQLLQDRSVEQSATVSRVRASCLLCTEAGHWLER